MFNLLSASFLQIHQDMIMNSQHFICIMKQWGKTLPSNLHTPHTGGSNTIRFEVEMMEISVPTHNNTTLDNTLIKLRMLTYDNVTDQTLKLLTVLHTLHHTQNFLFFEYLFVAPFLIFFLMFFLLHLLLIINATENYSASNLYCFVFVFLISCRCYVISLRLKYTVDVGGGLRLKYCMLD